MLNEQGNLITEGIPLTRDLLEFALANNYKISLKTGDYSKSGNAHKRFYNESLLSDLHELYVSGGCFIPNFSEVFEVDSQMILYAFKKRGMRILKLSEVWNLYGNFISEKRENTCIERCGYKNFMQNPEFLAQRVQKYREDNGVDNPM